MITLGGRAGAGKGTVADILSKKLGYEIIGIGATKRALATSMGLSIVEFDAIGDEPGKAEEFDLKYEQYQQSLNPAGSIILDSRLGFYNQPKAFNVFLDVDSKVAAQRIFDANRDTDAYSSVEEVLEKTKQREEKNRIRYKKLYNIDVYNFASYNILINTTHFLPEEVAKNIIALYKERQISP